MPSLTYQQIYELLTTVRDERRIHANTATRVGEAMLTLLAYIANAPYLKKDQEDATKYLLSLLGGAVIGESKQIRLNPDGSITCKRLVVEGSAIIDELVFNHQNVLEGDTYFTDKGIIDRVELMDGNRFRLTLRKLYDNDIVTFHAYDVVKCSMNNLDAGRTFRTSWMRVDAVDTMANTMDVTLYDNEDVPGGVNYAPEAAARMIRWGNQADPDRQQVFFISSKDGQFLYLQGVTQPILKDSNYAAFFGVPPQLDILKNLQLNARQPYIFARGIIYQDLIHVDYLGNPYYSPRDLGTWDSEHQYIRGYDETARGYFVDRVWWGGCLWQAAVSKPTIGKEPRYNNADWVCLLGGKNMAMEIWSTEGDAFAAGSIWSTTLIADLWNAEMQITEAEIGRQNIVWQRISEDTDGDVAWNIQHAQGSVGLQLSIISAADVPQPWSAKSKVRFVCSVLLSEMGTAPITCEYPIIG